MDPTPIVIALALVVLTAIVLLGWLLIQMQRQGTRFQTRLDLVAHQVANRAAQVASLTK